jgi:hypothetical protein
VFTTTGQVGACYSMRMPTNTIVRDQVDVAFYPRSLELSADQNEMLNKRETDSETTVAT